MPSYDPNSLDAQLSAINTRLKAIEDHIAGIRSDIAPIQARISALENWRWYVVGIGTAGGGVAALISKWLS